MAVLLLMLGQNSLARTTNSAPGSTTQPVGTQLTLNKYVNTASAKIGDVLTYTLVLSNSGSTTATNVVARDSSTTGLRYVSNSLSVPSGTVFSSGTPISIWTVASISAGQSFSLTYQAIADSSGILYTKATIPGDTATVCTSVPVKVCTGDTYIFRLTAAPGRSSYKWFRNSVEIAGQTTNVLDVTATGAYSLAIDNVSGSCPDFTCCPFVVEEDTLPTFRATALAATCVNGSAQTNGRITLTNYNSAYTYQYSAGADFNPAASLSGTAKAIPTGGLIANNLANPVAAQPYTIRVFNASGCYTDVTVLVQPAICCSLSAVVTAGQCATATNTYSATAVVTLTNPTPGTLTLTNGPKSTTFATTASTLSLTAVFTDLLSDGVSHTVTASLPGCSTATTTYTAPTSCSVVPAPTLALSVTPGTCQTATNTYSTTGVIGLTNAIAGTATFTDGTATATISISAGATSVPYSLSGLTSGTGSHTVTISYASQTISTTYTAPLSCSVAPAPTPTLVLSITPGECRTATNTYSLTGTLSLTNAIAGTATLTDGTTTTSLSISAGATSLPYALTGLLSGTGPHTVTVSYASQTFSQTYTAPLSCSVTPAPSLVLSVTPGECQTATNGYSINGTLSLTNATAGIATVTDGTNTATVSVSAGATALPYSLTGLSSGTGSHTVTVSYATQTLSQTYTAPASCTTAPVCSLSATVTAGVCQSATNTFASTVVITIANPTTATLTVTNAGQTRLFATTAATTTLTAVFENLISDGQPHTITASLPGCDTTSATYTAPASCSVVPTPAPSLAMSVTPGECQTATNTYQLSGTLSLTNATAGTATFTDGTNTATVSVGAGATSVPYALSGLSSGTGTHAIMVSYATQTLSQTYTAPASCSVAPAPTLALSALPGECQTATNTYSLTGTLSLTNATAGTATLVDGTTSTTISINAGATSVPYSLTGLLSGTGSHTVTISYAGQTMSQTYTAPASCSVVVAPVCSLSATAMAGPCTIATNTYSASVVVNLTNASVGTVTVSLPGSTPVSQPVLADTRSVTAVFEGLISNGINQTVTISLPDCSTTTATFTAPISCSVAPVCSVGVTAMAGTCDAVTNAYSATAIVTVLNPVANGTASVSLGQQTLTFSTSALSQNTFTATFKDLPADGQPHTITASLPGCDTTNVTYTAPVSCSVTPAPTLTLSALRGECQPATNTYSLTGTLSLTNAIAGTATITDGTSIMNLSISAGATSLPYALTGLPSGTGSHTVTISYAGQTMSQTYTAPASCSVAVAPVCSISATGTAGLCDITTNTFSSTVVVAITNPTTNTLTISNAGQSQTFTVNSATTSLSAIFTNIISDGSSHTITASLPGCDTTTATYTSPGSCRIDLGLAVADPGLCQPGTNTYSTTGVVSLTNAITGTATVTDGTATLTLSVSAGSTSLPYSMSGLTSGTGLRTVIVSYLGKTASTTYTAPASCSVTPVCSLTASVTAGSCSAISNTFSASVVINLTNAVGGTLTVDLPGSTPFSQVIKAGITSLTAQFDNLLSDGASHTATISLPGCATTTVTFTAPASCSVAPVCSVSVTATAGICDAATNTYSATAVITLTNPTPGTLTATNGPKSMTFATTAAITSLTAIFADLISDGGSHSVTVALPGCDTTNATYSAPASCSVAPAPTLALIVTPNTCQLASNTYRITGTLNLTNATAGTATFTDGTATAAVSVSAGATAVTYSLSGLSSGTGSHTVTVAYAGQTISQTYTAPASCTTAPVCSLSATVTAGVCQSATNTFSARVIVNITNPTTATLTITTAGQTQALAVTSATTSLTAVFTGIVSDSMNHTVAVSLPGCTSMTTTYTAPASCSVVARPALSSVADPGTCDPVTNTYSITGVISLTNAIAGTATLTDGSSTTLIAISAGATSVPYSLSGLTSGTGSRTVTVSYLGQTISTTYTAPASCSVTPAPTLTLSALPGECQPATNTYSLTGTLSLTNAIAGTATLTDGTTTTSLSISAGATSLPYALTGLLSGTGPHTVTVSYASQTLSQTYTAPLSCSVTPAPSLVLSVTPGECQTATNGYSISGTLSLTNATAGTATVTDGTNTATVSVSAGATALPYSLSGLSSGTGSHTVTVSYASQTLSQTYTAPASCSVTVPPAPVCSVSATATAIPVTCLGDVAQANGQIVLSGFDPAYTYQYSAGASFNAAASVDSAAKKIPANGLIANNLVNPATNQPYTVRIYSRADCYTDVVVTLQPSVCSCPVDVCVPFIIQQTKRPRRIGDAR